MSATIIYTPASGRKSMKTGGSVAWEQILRVFGSNPTLTGSELPILRALARASGPHNDEYWNELVDLVERHGEIALEVEY